MGSFVSPKHPLRRLFNSLTQKCFVEKIGVDDFEIVNYVAGLLIAFLHVDDLYWIRNSRGKRIHEVGEMLLEADRVSHLPGMKWEREIRKHIGDYTLFMAGLFPESISRQTIRDLDYLIDYIAAGRESYRMVAEFDRSDYPRLAPLYTKLSRNFEICTFGLNCVKEELEALQDPAYRQMRDLLLE